LKQDGDHVRRELEIANEEKMTTIPILLGRDAPPSRSEIPASLSFIWDLKFATFQMDDWAVAMQQLKSAIDAALSPRRTLQT
jgi:hypothetical protein